MHFLSKRHITGVLSALLLTISTVQGADKTGPWDLEQLFKAPTWHTTELAPKPGMTGILYDSISYLGQPTQVFAYYSAPTGTVPDGGWPAVVCVHGGGGTAFEFWVKAWNDHGYAAISMDLEGHLPLAAAEGAKGRQPTPKPGPQRIGVFNDYKKPLNEQWYFHAVAQIVEAHSLLGSFPEVNADKIGVTGVSWGGTLTSTVMGLDSRYKFAIPGYGCGFLSDSSGHQGRTIQDGEHADTVNKYFDGSAYFSTVTYPTLWVNGMNDFHFSMPAMQQSAQAVNGPATMRFELGMKHGHGPVIRTEECYIFADSVIKGGIALPRFGTPTANGKQATISVSSAQPLSAAALLITTDADSIWPDKKWEPTPVSIENGQLTGTLPPGTFALCFTATNYRGAMVSSEFLQHSVAGVKKSVIETTPNEINFDAKFSELAEATGATILIADNFEANITPAVSKSLNLKDPANKAGINEWYDNVASGGKSLMISNSTTVEQPHQPCLSKWLKGAQTITHGTVKIGFDLFIPSTGGNSFSVALRDYTAKPSVNHITMSVTDSGAFSINRKGLTVAKDQWVHYTLSLPVGVQDAKLIATTTDSENGEQRIELPVINGNVNAISWAGFMLPGKQDGNVFLDNLVFTVVK